jgi:hypothetical protein
MAEPQDDDKIDIEVIDRQQEENGDYSFTFIMTPKQG